MDDQIAIRKKSVDDILLVQEVQKAVESAMNEVVLYLKKTDNPSSEEAHEIIDSVLLKYDCESPAGHIVSGGRLSAEPHEIGSGLLPRNEPIVIDIYPRSKSSGYFADMSRTVCIGEPSPELKRMYSTVLEAQKLAISMVEPGIKCISIQQAVEDLFTSAGYETSGIGKEFPFAMGFVHGVGHGVGKNIHEIPRIGRKSEDVLEVGDLITIEPGLYYQNIGGIRIEDLLWVTTAGAQNLSHYPKEFEI